MFVLYNKTQKITFSFLFALGGNYIERLFKETGDKRKIK